MIKTLLFVLLLCTSTLSSAQNSFETELDSIQNEKQATKFIENHKLTNGTIYVFNKEKHKTQLAQDLFKTGKGGSKVIANANEKTHYKVIDSYDITYYRVSYVYLDGTNKTKDEIFEWEQVILAKYQQGYKFRDLAKQYSMDTNATRGGDSGWFLQGTMNAEFEEAVISSPNSVGDLFTVNIPNKNSYYVVLKTFEPKMIEEIKVLQVTEKI